jgi:hypothetical protein
LNPQSSGGLWLAVMLRAAIAWLALALKLMTGVGVAAGVSKTVKPLPARTFAGCGGKVFGQKAAVVADDDGSLAGCIFQIGGEAFGLPGADWQRYSRRRFARASHRFQI